MVSLAVDPLKELLTILALEFGLLLCSVLLRVISAMNSSKIWVGWTCALPAHHRMLQVSPVLLCCKLFLDPAILLEMDGPAGSHVLGLRCMQQVSNVNELNPSGTLVSAFTLLVLLIWSVVSFDQQSCCVHCWYNEETGRNDMICRR